MACSYVLRYDEIYKSFNYLADWVEGVNGRYCISSELDLLLASYKRFVDETIKLEGNTGTRLRCYFAEGPLMALSFAMELIAQFDEGNRRYAGGLLEYDSSTGFKLDYNALSNNASWLFTHENSFTSLDTQVQNAIRSANSYLNLEKPSPDGVLQYYQLIRERNVKLRVDVGTYESKSVRDTQDIRALVDALNAYLDGWESERPTDKNVDYVPGTINDSDWAKDALDKFSAAYQNRGSRQEELWAADWRLDNYEYQLAYEAELAEMAAARETQGWVMFAIAAVAIVLAVVAIVLTCGAAAPIIAAGAAAGATATVAAIGTITSVLMWTTVVAGTAYVGYNVCNAFEGLENVHYGKLGDVTTPAYNFGRDTVFGGNQEAWDTFGTVSGAVMGVASAGVGLAGAASTAATSMASATAKATSVAITRAVGVEFGKMVISGAVGTAAGYGGTLLGNKWLGEEWGWTVGMVCGIGASLVTGWGLNKIDAKYNLSGLHGKPVPIDTPEAPQDTPEDIIKQRTKDLDLEAHPSDKKQLSNKQMKELKAKIENRTITQEEYKLYEWNNKIDALRKSGVKDFWTEEAVRIRDGNPTRNWTSDQADDILNGVRPKVNGKTMHGHHTYSVSEYPHLAGKHEVIWPASYQEHLFSWHGGNWQQSLPGMPWI